MNVHICDACGHTMNRAASSSVKGMMRKRDPKPVTLDMSQPATTMPPEMKESAISNVTRFSNPPDLLWKDLGRGNLIVNRIVVSSPDADKWCVHISIGNRNQEPFMERDERRWKGDPPLNGAQFAIDAPMKQNYEQVEYMMDVSIGARYAGEIIDRTIPAFECVAECTFAPDLEEVSATICVDCAQPMLRAISVCDASRRADKVLAPGTAIIPVGPELTAGIASAFSAPQSRS